MINRPYKYNKSFERMKANICDHSCGIMPAPLEAQQVVNILIDYLLGEDWYVVSPMNQKQVNACAAEQILDKYSKKWQKDWKHYEKEGE